MSKDIKLPKSISGCGLYGEGHLAGQIYQDALDCDNLATVRERVVNYQNSYDPTELNYKVLDYVLLNIIDKVEEKK